MATKDGGAGFVGAIQEIFPKLMHYLEAEESRELTGLEVTPSQMNALVVLYLQDGQTMGSLSAELYLGESAATRLVDRLFRMNLVRRRGDEKDRRVVRVHLTSYGRQLAELVFKRRSERFARLAARLTPAERGKLIEALKAVLRGFRELEEEHGRRKEQGRKGG